MRFPLFVFFPNVLFSFFFFSPVVLWSNSYTGEILLGQSAALTGSSAALGQGMRTGLNTYFSKLNEEGGLHGKKVTLITLDDGYEPERAIDNTHKFIDDLEVFCLIGAVGTPTTKAVLPLINKEDIPYVGAFTGAAILREPHNRLIVNLRGSYDQEMEKIISYLHDEKQLSRIFLLYQNDSYGRAGMSALEKAISLRGIKIVGRASYERNTTAVKRAVLATRKIKPEAVVMVGSYQACSKFIKVSKELGLDDLVFCNISFVGTQALSKSLGESSTGTIISQVVPDPFQSNLPVVQQYRKDLKDYDPKGEPDWISLEGYLVGVLFSEIYKSVDPPVTREKFVDHVQKIGTFDLGGITLDFGKQDNQGMEDIFLTILKEGKAVAL